MSQGAIWYQRAVARWPSVKWNQAAYFKHLNGDSPAYPVDLFLGGAAGYGQNVAWAVIEDEIGTPVRKTLPRLPLAGHTPEQIWSDTVERQMSPAEKLPVIDGIQPSRIASYRGKVSLHNYFILLCKNRAIQIHRQSKNTREASLDAPGLPRDPVGVVLPPDASVQERELLRTLSQKVATAVAKLSPEQRFILSMELEGLQQNQIAVMLKFSTSKVSRHRDKALAILAADLADLDDPDLRTPDVMELWKELVKNFLRRVQFPRDQASE